MAEGSILTASIFTDFIFPFLLVFVVIFALLEKTKLFGEERRQINALVSLFISLIFLAFEGARLAIVNFMPLVVIAIIFILIFMMLWGFVGGSVEKGMNKGLKITFGILIGLFVIIAGLYVTGAWNTVYDSLFAGGSAGKIWVNILILAIIGGAVALVLSTGKGKESK
jgi:hypothetical protein